MRTADVCVELHDRCILTVSNKTWARMYEEQITPFPLPTTNRVYFVDGDDIGKFKKNKKIIDMREAH